MNTILLFVGPSCSGKTTLMRELLQRHPEMFERLKSFTSRARRDGEDDMEYDFVSVEDVVHMQKSGDVTQQVFLNGNWYGTRTSDIDRIIASGKVPVCIVEPGGVTQFTKVGEDKGFKPLTFYINGSSETILRRWLERVAAEPKTPLKYLGRILSTLEEEIPNWRRQTPNTHKEFYDCDSPEDLDLILRTIYVEASWVLRSRSRQ